MPKADIEGTVSLVIAVAGHRDLFEEDEEEIRASISSFLLSQRSSCPDNPLLLITGMAEGADCLAVEAALEAKPPIPYVAVLPFESSTFYATFSSPEMAERSRNLMAGAKYTIVLPRVEGSEQADLFENAEARDLQFEAQSMFLAQASQILLAVYDNSPTHLKGGTSDTIASKLGRKVNPCLEDCSGLNNSGIGPVHYILVRRKRSGEQKPVSTSKQTEYPIMRPGATEAAYTSSYLLQNEFNKQVASEKQKHTDVSNSRASLYPSFEATSHPSPAMKWTADHFAWADHLAMQNQKLAEGHWNAVFLLLATALAILVPLHTIPRLGHSLRMEFTYYLAILVAFILGWTEHRQGYRRKHEDYRALAEALRVQFFWLAAGIGDLAAEFYLSKQTGEMVWVRDAMSEVSLESARADCGPKPGGVNQISLSLARTWVKTQTEYFLRKARRHARIAKACNRIALGLFSLAVTVQLFLTISFHTVYGHLSSLQNSTGLRDWGFGASALAIGFAGLLRSFSEIKTYSQLGRQYERMYSIFSTASQLLEADEKENSVQARLHAKDVIRDLGRAALQENGDWMMMHRERQLNIMMSPD